VRCFTATHKNKKIHHGAFVLSTLALHLTELSKVFQAGYIEFAVCTGKSFRRTVHQ